jgi:hypothetical protein
MMSEPSAEDAVELKQEHGCEMELDVDIPASF